jgi:hypothetical protein
MSGVPWRDLAPRELCKAAMRCDGSRGYIPDAGYPLAQLVNDYRCSGHSGSSPHGYAYETRGLHIYIAEAQGVRYDPPLRFTLYELLAELRAEALTPARQLSLW